MLAFLLSEHILCKESILIVKKFDFEILTYLFVSKPAEFIYAIFTVMYTCSVAKPGKYGVYFQD